MAYFAKPQPTLDPRLFEGDHLRNEIRNALLDRVYLFWRTRYSAPESWSTVWLAGSALTRQWDSSVRGDLDTLIGVNHQRFIAANRMYQGLSPEDMAKQFNSEFRENINMDNWRGFEVTFYVNPGASDIRMINPYAAYNLTTDSWTVKPLDLPEDWDPTSHFSKDWWDAVRREEALATDLLDQYDRFGEMASGRGPQARSAQALQAAAEKQAIALFDAIHEQRRIAFSPGGKGYMDFHNFRWQALKHSGVISRLRGVKDTRRATDEMTQQRLYGAKVDDARSALRRASLSQYQR